jgi:hypothetical protein
MLKLWLKSVKMPSHGMDATAHATLDLIAVMRSARQ